MSQAHWDSVYAVDNLDELGWYQLVPSTLGLVRAYSTPADSGIDVLWMADSERFTVSLIAEDAHPACLSGL